MNQSFRLRFFGFIQKKKTSGRENAKKESDKGVNAAAKLLYRIRNSCR